MNALNKMLLFCIHFTHLIVYIVIIAGGNFLSCFHIMFITYNVSFKVLCFYVFQDSNVRYFDQPNIVMPNIHISLLQKKGNNSRIT